MVFGQATLYGVELEVETSRVMAYRNGNCTEDQGYRMIALQDLEEAHNVSIQAERKEKNDSKLPRSHGIQQGGLVLLYDNRHEQFPGKPQTRRMGLYRVMETFENGLLQLENLQGNWLGTKVNDSRVKQYRPEIPIDGESAAETNNEDS